MLALVAGITLAGCNAPQMQFETINVEAPFEMEAIRVPIYPAQDFCITAYGATDTTLCTGAIAQAIADCHAAGGGRVVIPAGEWLTAPIHLKSNVNLYLAEGAVVMKNIQVDCVADTTNGVKNVEALSVEDVTYNSVNPATLPQLDRYLSNK